MRLSGVLYGPEGLQYSEDTQLYISISMAGTADGITRCLEKVEARTRARWLQLSPDKTKGMLIGCRKQAGRSDKDNFYALN